MVVGKGGERVGGLFVLCYDDHLLSHHTQTPWGLSLPTDVTHKPQVFVSSVSSVLIHFNLAVGVCIFRSPVPSSHTNPRRFVFPHMF